MSSQIKVYIDGSEVEFAVLSDFNFTVNSVDDINKYIDVECDDMVDAANELFNEQFKNNIDVYSLDQSVLSTLKYSELPYCNKYPNSCVFILGKDISTDHKYPMALTMYPIKISNQLLQEGTNYRNGLSIETLSTEYSKSYNQNTNTLTFHYVINFGRVIDLNRIIMTRNILNSILASGYVNSASMRYLDDDNLVYIQLPIVESSGTVVSLPGAVNDGLSPFNASVYHFLGSDGSIHAVRLPTSSPGTMAFNYLKKVNNSISTKFVNLRTIKFDDRPVVVTYKDNNAYYVIDIPYITIGWTKVEGVDPEDYVTNFPSCVTVCDDAVVYAVSDTYSVLEYSNKKYGKMDDRHGNPLLSPLVVQLVFQDIDEVLHMELLDLSFLAGLPLDYFKTLKINEKVENSDPDRESEIITKLITPVLLCAYYRDTNTNDSYLAVKTARNLTSEGAGSFTWEKILVVHLRGNSIVSACTCEDSDIQYGNTVSDNIQHIGGMFFKVGGVMFFRMGTNGCVNDTQTKYYKRVNTWIISTDVLTDDNEYPKRHIEFTTITPLTNNSQIRNKQAYGLVPLGGNAGENKFLHYDPVKDEYRVVELDTNTAPVMLDLLLNNTVSTDSVTIDISIQPNTDTGGS